MAVGQGALAQAGIGQALMARQQNLAIGQGIGNFGLAWGQNQGAADSTITWSAPTTTSAYYTASSVQA